MALNDALRRIVGQHWLLLCAWVLGGLAIGLLLAPGGKLYGASARLVLDTPDPVARQQSQAYSDTAKAIATSRSAVAAALGKAGARRGDPGAYADSHVSVKALGSSGVMEITVTDRDRNVAAIVANSLAASLIKTRLEVSNGAVNRTFDTLDNQIAGHSRRIPGVGQQGG